MKIKRFTGTDMRAVMSEIRRDFGPDAVILETARAGGQLEVTAAMDFDPAAYSASDTTVRRETGSVLDGTDEDFPPPPDAPQAPSSGDEVAQVRAEVQGIRSLLEAQLARLVWNEQNRRAPETTGTMRNLTRLGLTADIVQRLLDSAPPPAGGSPWATGLRSLVDSLPVCEQELIDDGGIFALIGPTGAGKTTSIAKLAARHAERHGSGQVALVTTDDYRVGAFQQLEIYGGLLGERVYRPGDDGLGALLQRLSRYRLVLIDSAGISPRDLRLAQQLRQLRDAGHALRSLLVLPATAQTDSMQEIVDVFRTAQPAACILSKIDEAASLGGAFSVLIRSRLPLAYVANGQRVPEDLHFARARQAWLVKAAVELINRRREPVSEDYLAEHFAEVASDACA